MLSRDSYLREVTIRLSCLCDPPLHEHFHIDKHGRASIGFDHAARRGLPARAEAARNVDWFAARFADIIGLVHQQ
ncbi:MAG: hypothetical protein CL952_06480, partial [Erythrobacteraceae bacterium]|nr:hypothetical protein [Erythrobacteraceae bacterium]